MKSAALAVVAVVLGVALGLAAVFVGFPPAPAGGAGEEIEGRLDREARALGELASRVQAIEEALADLRRPEVAREVVPPSRLDLPGVADDDRASREPPSAFDPRRLLAEYVASFEGGGEGSEFHRMAVAAYAWELRVELRAIVADGDYPDALMLQVIAMLGGGSFRRDGETIDALLMLLRQGGFEQGELAALDVLARIGDRRTADLVEAITPLLQPLRVRAAAWQCIASLCGGAADSVLLRLFERESEPEGRVQLLALFRGTDLAASLRAWELASRMEKEVRVAAAGRIGGFRDEPFVALTEEWLGYETDDEVRALLLAALEQQKQIPAWHELQATGAPNVENPSNDDQRAWAPASADGGQEWIELSYSPARHANRVTIHETSIAGGVVEVEVMEEGGAWRSVFRGEDPLAAAGPFEIRFATSDGPVARVRVTLDTARRRGWEEIDAVELSGPRGSAWASHAVASSRYGSQGWGMNEATMGLRASEFPWDVKMRGER